MNLNINIYDNGSFDLKLGDAIVRNCFPGIDGSSVKPLSCTVTKKVNLYEILYETLEGSIILTINQENENIYLKSRLVGFAKMPYYFSPVQSALIENFDGIFRQGFGLGGPSGYNSLKTHMEKKQDVFSYGLISLASQAGFLFITADDHKRFINSYKIGFSESDNIFWGQNINKTTSFSVNFQTEKIQAADVELPVIHIFAESDLHTGLTIAAEKISSTMKARTHNEPAYHWCSWYYLYHFLSQEILKEYMEGFSKLKPPIPLKYIQIDAGYFTSPGDWLLNNHLWPSGLKAAFDDIKKYGYKPGIWIAPFMVGSRSVLFKEHPDWVLHTLDDKPFSAWKIYNEPKLWGYLDEDIYILDSSHPDAMAYIMNVFKTFREWGVELYKTDFMLLGIQDSTQINRFLPGKTSVEYYRDFLEEVRKEIGEESYWLGCIAPFLPSIGYADGMRIAGDVGAQWDDEGFGPTNMIREVVADNYFNHVYWQNDPDAVMLRDFHIYLNETEIEAVALFQAISGGAVYTSDPIHELPESRANLFRFIKPDKKVKPALPFLNEERREIVMVCKFHDEDKYILFFFNPTKEEITEYYKIQDLTNKKGLFLNLWKSEKCDDKMRESITVKIPPHGCKLYFGSSKEVVDTDRENLWS